MKLHIFAKSMDLTPSMEKIVENKISASLKHLLFSLDSKMDIAVDVALGKMTAHHKEGKIWFCEVNVVLPGRPLSLRVKSREESFEAAVNVAKDELLGRITRFKNKKNTRNRRSARIVKKRIQG